MLRVTTDHDEPRDEGRVSDIPETAGVDVHLHLQVEEEALVDDVGNPAGRTAQREGRAISKTTTGNKSQDETSSCECAADF